MSFNKLAAFGPGALFVRRTDIADQTPVNIGKCQSFELGMQAEEKDLFGENDFALVSAISTKKLTGKVKAALISGIALNAVMFGSAFTAGMTRLAIDEVATADASTHDFTVTHGANFLRDNGVVYKDTGLPLTYTSSAPSAAGQYTVDVATGKYTLHTSDAGKQVKASYAYTDSATGQSQTISAQPIGTTPYFRVDYQITGPGGVPFFIGLMRCISTKLQHSFKINDFDMPELDFNCQQDDAGNVVTFGYGNVA